MSSPVVSNFDRTKALEVLRRVMPPDEAHYLTYKTDTELLLLLKTVRDSLLKEKTIIINQRIRELKREAEERLKSLRQLLNIAKKIGGEIPEWILTGQLENYTRDYLKFAKQQQTPIRCISLDWLDKVSKFTEKVALVSDTPIVIPMIMGFFLVLTPLESLRTQLQSEIGRKDKELIEKYDKIDFTSMKHDIEDIIHKIDTLIQDLSILKKKRFLDGFWGRLFGISQKVSKIKENALEVVKKTSSVFYKSGVMYRKIFQYDKAIADFTEAIKLNPNYANAYNERGICYRELGRDAEAEKDFNKAKELKNNERFFREAHCYLI